MLDPEPLSNSPQKRRSFLHRLFSLLSTPEPVSRDDLITIIQDAKRRNLVDADALAMIEGVFRVTDLRARDIMIPRGQINTIEEDQLKSNPEMVLNYVMEKGHSRYPVYNKDKETFIGILLAKDLLHYYHLTFFQKKEVHLNEWLRPIVFITESKRLKTLLHDFRDNKNHMAIVVNEYGHVSGLLTIEDVLEEIVGDIEDEFDLEENDHIVLCSENQHRVSGLTKIEDFNAYFCSQLNDNDFDTIGGLVTSYFGRVPLQGESINILNLHFKVAKSDARRAQSFLVSKVENKSLDSENIESEFIKNK